MEKVDPGALSLKDLMAAVGLLLLEWGGLEQDIDAALGRAGPDVASLSISDGLARWAELACERRPADEGLRARVTEVRARADEIRRIRNNLSHRLLSARAADGPDEAVLTCGSSEGEEFDYTWSDLVRAIRDLERIRDMVRTFATEHARP